MREVKDLILPTIIKNINQNDLKNTGFLKEDIAEVIYTDIMALGYNDRDINAAVNDLMPYRNPIFYPGPEEADALHMAIDLCMIDKELSNIVEVFQTFHKMTQKMRPHDEIINDVKKKILSIENYNKQIIRNKILVLGFYMQEKDYKNETIEEMEVTLNSLLKQRKEYLESEESDEN